MVYWLSGLITTEMKVLNTLPTPPHVQASLATGVLSLEFDHKVLSKPKYTRKNCHVNYNQCWRFQVSGRNELI